MIGTEMDRPYLSLALLSYNEEELLEKAGRITSEILESLGVSYELVFVDDGSTDRSREIIEQLTAKLPHSRYIYHPRNLGLGAGIRSCYFGTTGEWAVWLPADLQADPRELRRLLQYLPDCDVLVTYRDHQARTVSLLRKLVSLTDRTLVRVLFGVSLIDLHWIRFFRRSVLDRMALTTRSSTVIDTEMIIFAKMQRARILEVPLGDLPREAGVARGASPRFLVRAFRDMFALRMRKLRLVPEGQPGTLSADRDPFWAREAAVSQ